MKLISLLILFIPLFSLADEQFESLQNDTVIALYYFNAGDSCRRTENFEEALQNYFKASEIYKNNHLFLKSAVVLNRIGKVYRLEGNYEKALKYDIESLKSVESTADSKNKALYLNNIGIDYYRINDFEKALDFLTESLTMRKNISDSLGTADSYNNLAMVYDDIGKRDKALDYYHKALGYYQQIDEPDGVAAVYNNIAGVYYQKNEPDKVLEFALKSLGIRKKMKNKRNIAFNMINIGSLYRTQGNYDSAISFVKQGIELAKEVGALPQIRDGYNSLAKTYALSSNYKEAYKYHKLFKEVNDSIFREKSTRAIAEMQTKYETEKKVKENEFLKRDVETKKTLQKYLFAIIFGLVIMSVIIYYFFRLKSKSLKQSKKLLEQETELYRLEKAEKESQKRYLESKIFAEKQINRLQKEKYEAEIEMKNNQLVNSTLCIVNKNEVLHQIKDKIKQKREEIDKGKEISYELIRFINNNIDRDQGWKKFRLKFEEIHPGFFRKLTEKYPGLSENFIRLCSYIRINLTTNEIAQLMNISIESVKKNRQRLRKKLNIDTDTLLVDFMKNI